MDVGRAVKILSPSTYTFLGEVEQSSALPAYFNSHRVNKCPFCGLLSVMFSHCLWVFLVILLIKMPPLHIANILSNVPKGRKVAMCLMEKMHVLNKFHPDINCSAFSCEFSVYESTIYIK